MSQTAFIDNLVAIACANPEPDAMRKCLAVFLKDYKVAPLAGKRRGSLQKSITLFLGAKRIEGLSEKTLENYSLYLARFASAQEKPAGAITADDIRAFVGGLQLKASSLQTVLATLRSFFGWLHREELISKNPMNKIPAPKRSSARQLPKALSVEALELVRTACIAPREQALVEFLYSTGCRVSEVVGIDLANVDFTTRTVKVLGKGGRERMVYFSVRAGLLLQSYIKARKGGSMLFANIRAPYGAVSARSIEKIVHSIGQRAQLKENVWPHRFRHTMATRAHNNGMQITVLQALLGHRQLSTTQIYATVSMDNIRHEHERFVA